MNSYLLTLAALHAAAPGAIDVVFGPDGDFEGAPRFTGPVLGRIRGELPMGYHHVCTSYEPDQIGVMRNDGTRKLCDAPALDLRIPSVAARLAGLCARALGAPPPVVAYVVATGVPEHGFLVLRAEWLLIGERRWCWNRDTGADLSMHPTGIRLPPRCDAASALAALTFALAPRIAALRSTT